MNILKIFATTLLIGSAGMMTARAEIEEGDTREAVIEALGEPNGTVMLGETEILYYKRGQVDIRDGKVAKQSIVSEAEAEELAKKRQEEENKYFAEIEKQKAQRRAAAAARAEAAAPKEGEAAAPTADDLRKKAEIEAKIQEGLKDPGIKTSSRKLRKYRRGRSQSAIDAREAQLRKEYETD